MELMVPSSPSLPRRRPRRGTLVGTHHVRCLEPGLRRRLRLLLIAVLVRRERRHERLLRLRVRIVRHRRGRRRGLLVEIPCCSHSRSRRRSRGPASGRTPPWAPGWNWRQLVAVLVGDAARGRLLPAGAVVFAQVVHEATLFQPLLDHLVHQAVVADEAPLVLALVVASRTLGRGKSIMLNSWNGIN